MGHLKDFRRCRTRCDNFDRTFLDAVSLAPI